MNNSQDDLKAQDDLKEQDANYSFDLASTLQDLTKRWFVILLSGIIAAIGCFITATQLYSPQYMTSTTLLVQSKNNTESAYNNLTATNKMAGVFKNILDSSQLQNSAARQLGYTSFPGNLSCSVIEETNILSFTVTSDSPIKSYRLLKAVLECYPQFTKNVVSSIVLQTLEEPVVPTEPTNPSNALKLAVIGFFAGAAAAVLIISVLSFYKDTVKKESDINKKLITQRLVSIPTQKKRLSVREKVKGIKRPLSITNPVISFEFREAFKRLRQKIVSDSKTHHNKVYAVTSSLENEGKTTVAVNLALSLAKMDYKVLLIDGDLRKPAVAKFLEAKITNGKSIIDFLRGKARLSEIASYDEINNITIMGSNKGTQQANELITGEKMDYLLSVAREQYDYIIIDTPPLCFVSDAEDILTLSDSSLIVVRRNVANALSINDTIDIILASGVKLMGCVYNDAENVSIVGRGSVYSDYQYGKYGYGKYGYGKYGKYGSTAE